MSVPQPVERPIPGRRHHLIVAVLAMVLGLVAAPAGPVIAREPSSTREPAAGLLPGSSPSQMYEDAMEHAADPISFTPGDRVTVGFRPRASDRWTVDGGAPRALPAGRMSGREMAGLADGPEASSTAPGPDRAVVPTPSPAAEAGPGPAPAPTASPDPTPTPTPEPVETLVPSPIPDSPLPPADAPAGAIPVAAETVAFRSEPVGNQSTPALPAGLRREVYGFLPYWEVGASSTRLDYSVLSHIAYFSVGADAGGNLLKRDPDGSLTTGWAGWTSQRMTDVINGAHARGSRVTLTITVFAWTSGQLTRQKALLGSAAARANLARQAVAAVRNRGADGINLDFEPLASGYEDEFVALVRSIRAEFSRYSRGYHLSFDTMGSPGNYPLESALASGGADAVFIMGYDYRTASSGYAGSIDPLAGPAYDLADTLDRYLARVPASRVILGIPYYGRAWSTVSDSRNARTQTGAKYGYSATVSYENAVKLAADYGRRWDTRELSAWVAYRRQNCTSTYGCVMTWRQAYYDDATSLKLRYDLINRSGLRGAGIWALGYDGTRTELYRALADKFLRDTTPPLAGIVVLPATVGDEGFSVRWRATDDWSGVASYDVQVAIGGGSWRAWKTATTATGDIWLGRDGTGYAFRVRARDTKGNVSAWKVTSGFESSPALRVGGFARPAIADVAMRTAPDASAAVVATLDPAHIVAIVDGPVTADGYTWYEVVGPLYQWAPVGAVRTDVWMAAGGAGTTLLTPVRAPNATLVTAILRGFSFGNGGPDSLGASGAAQRAFSPNGDESRDRLGLRWSNRRDLDSLELRVLATDGTLLGSSALPDLAAGAQAHAWDGRAAGAVLPDGKYLLQLFGTAGSSEYHAPSASPATAAQIAAYAVTIDTVPPTLKSATISSARFSPDGDGRLDTVTVSGSASGGATGWRLIVSPVQAGQVGGPVRTTSGSGSTARTSWDGRTDGGSSAPDGTYRLTLALLDAAGNAAQQSWTVVVDRRDPAVTVTAEPAAFSPNGDRTADTARLSWTSDETASAWLAVYRGTALVVRWPYSGTTAGAATWNGRDAAGRAVPDGRYSVRATVTDRAGNRTVRTAPVVVDRTASALSWSPSAFFPQDADSVAATSRVSFRLTRSAVTRLQLFDASGRVVRTPWSTRTLGPGTASWTWNGRTAAGVMLPRGRYTAVLTVTSSIGTIVLRRHVLADAFNIAPSTTSPTAGQVLVLTISSVEPLAGSPRVTLRQSGTAPVAATVARLADGRWRATVRIAAGAPGPASVTVTGRDTRGGTNTTVLGLPVR